jgi:sterol desaturase/sphingolipid hydroxylase (fatty acid hydroxylase superfamily)
MPLPKEGQRMRLSKTGYYADFAIYAGVLVAVATVTAIRNTAYETSLWLLTAAIGTLAWTLIEYILHRFVLHRIPVFAAMHAVHHDAPLAYVGTPTWLSLGIIAGFVFLPSWLLGSLNTASGLAVGVMAGFFWYGIVHHAIHYRRPRLIATRLIQASRRHAQHHYGRQSGNFGVTTQLWDHVFGTALSTSRDGLLGTE